MQDFFQVTQNIYYAHIIIIYRQRLRAIYSYGGRNGANI